MSDVKKEMPVVACPTCQKQVAWSAENPNRPFCSDRCKLIDLGEWLHVKSGDIDSKRIVFNIFF